MSTAAQSPPAPASATQSGTSGYSISRPQGKCSVCGRDIAPGEKFFAAVRQVGAQFDRVDISPDCWKNFDQSALLAFWQTTMPSAAAAKPKVFVDDTVLCDLFERLAESASEEGEAARLNFRFVLGLVLMRKRLLTLVSTHGQAGSQFWTVRLKGREQTIDLRNPRLDEEQIAQVTAQLGQILNDGGASGEAA